MLCWHILFSLMLIWHQRAWQWVKILSAVLLTIVICATSTILPPIIMIDLYVNSFCGKFNVFHISTANMGTILALVSKIQRFDRREHLVQIIVIYWRITHASVPTDRHRKRKGPFLVIQIWCCLDMKMVSTLLVLQWGNPPVAVVYLQKGSIMRHLP